MMQDTGAVVEPEQQRPDAHALHMRTESADDAVDGSEMLHLHPPPLPVQVPAWRVAGDDSVESGALVALKPLCRLVWGTGLRRGADRAIDADHVEKVAPAHVERLLAEIRVVDRQDIEEYGGRRCLLGE